MSRKSLLSVFVALFLMLGTVAPCVVESRALDETAVAVVAVETEAEGDAEKSEKPKGNGFARALGAPFRALARLFGGGRKKRSEEAKKQKQDAAPKSVASAKTDAPANNETRLKDEAAARAAKDEEKRRAEEQKRAERERKKKETAKKSETVKKTETAKKTEVVKSIEPAAQTAAAQPASVVSPTVPADAKGNSQAESVRIVRPADGRPVSPVTPKWVPVIEGISRDPLTQGRALLQHGYINEAISELSIATTVGPDLVEANNLLGLAYDRLGSHAQAVEAYERALSAAPDNPQVLNNLGYSLHLAGRHSDALKRLREAERLAPGAPYVLQNIALVQAGMGKFGDAYKAFVRAFGEYEARLKTAELLAQANRHDAAIKHYTAALRIQPNNQPVIERLVELYERTGRRREAEEARRALSNPTNKQKTTTGGG